MKKKGNVLSWLLIPILSLSVAPLALAADECTAVYGKGPNRFALATGSPGELGLLEKLIVPFNRKHDVTICWKKAGSGKSLRLLKTKAVDMVMVMVMVMVHAPAAEKQAVEAGWATKRTLIGANEFYLSAPRPIRHGSPRPTVRAMHTRESPQPEPLSFPGVTTRGRIKGNWHSGDGPAWSPGVNGTSSPRTL